MKKVLIGGYLVITICIFAFLFNNEFKGHEDNKAKAAGETIFKQQCAACHGKTGKGIKSHGGTALNNQHFLNSVTDKDLSVAIKQGRTGTAMPGYRSNLSEEDLHNLVAFIRNWQTEKIKLSSPKVMTGKPDNGSRLYKLYCQTCHGENGAGKENMGPSLSNPDYLKYTSDNQIWISTAYGREETGMGPSLKGLDGVRQLKQQEIFDIVSYIRSQQKK